MNNSKIQIKLINKFNSYYSSKNYKCAKAEKILSNIDPSTIFIGSTISPLKKYLNNTIPVCGLSIIQPCIRTQKSDYFYNNDKILEYNSFFIQAGILSSANNYERICDESIEFLTKIIGIDKKLIKVKINRNDADLYCYWKRQSTIKIEVNSHTNNYYRWNYGIDQIIGKGLTYAIKKDGANIYRDIGNIIIIYKKRKKIAVEWGFGIETLISRIYNLPKPQSASKICDILPFREGLQEKTMDTLVTAIEMYKLGIKPGMGRERHLLKTYLKGLDYLRRKLNIPIKRIKEIAEIYQKNDKQCLDISNELVYFLEQRDLQRKKYSNWSRDIMASCLARGIDPKTSLIKLQAKLGLRALDI